MRGKKVDPKISDENDEPKTERHMVRLIGKIVRDGECPFNKPIPCEECEFLDGWGIDLKIYEMHIYCRNPNIIGDNVSFIPITCKECVEYPCETKYCEIYKPKGDKNRR